MTDQRINCSEICRSVPSLLAALLIGGILSPATVFGQIQPRSDAYHQPLSQHSPPGQTAAWMNAIRNYDMTWLQPLQIEVPGGGQVDVYSGYNHPVGGGYSPMLLAVNVGHVYRLRVSGMPKYPGLEIYPSIELIDHLHPPAGRENEFPIPIILTDRDIQIAESGQLVTRVIYLEQPQIAQQLNPLRREIPQAVEPKDNALQEADRLGRPMAIIRVGGRRPSTNSPPAFFGTGGHVEVRPAVINETMLPPGSVKMQKRAVVRNVSHEIRK
jgi:hypothetical protein